MPLHFEDSLTERHLLLFGRIIQSYARHEILMERIMATISGADPTSIKLMTSHLPFGWKRATMLNLLRHRGLPRDRIDEVQSYFDLLHTMQPLHDDIVHSGWIQCEPETMVKPSWLESGPRSAVKPLHDVDGASKAYVEDYPEGCTYTLDYFQEIADRLEGNEASLRDYLAGSDLTPPQAM